MMSALLALAQSGGLDGDLLTSSQFYQTDFTKPLMFLEDGNALNDRATYQHLQGEQWGMMNETGSYPGQVWLWLYTFWYQVSPISTLGQRRRARNGDHGRAERMLHPRPVPAGHPRDPAPDPGLQADLARLVRGCGAAAEPPPSAPGSAST